MRGACQHLIYEHSCDVRYTQPMANPTPNTTGLTPGGQSLSGTGHSPRMTITLPDHQMTQLAHNADTRGMSRAKLARIIIGDWLTDHA